MANLRTIQFLRNGSPYESLAAAKSALTTKASELLDGSPIVGRYTSGDTELSVLGIVHVSGGTKGITFFESANDVEARIKQLESELNAAEAAVGLNENGSKVEKTGKYTSGASTVEAEIDALNDAIVAVEGVVDGLDYGPIGGTDASVLTQIQQADGKISGLTANVGTLKLTDYSQGTNSGDVASSDSINEAVAKLQNQAKAEIAARTAAIEALDYTDTAETGSYVSAVDEENGVISVTRVALPTVSAISENGKPITAVSESLGQISATAGTIEAQYVTTNTTDKDFTGTTVQAALEEISSKVKANKIVSGDKTITVTPANDGSSTDVAVNIDGTTIIKNETTGVLSADLKIKAISQGESSTYASQYQLVYGTSETPIGDIISVGKDQFLKEADYDPETQKLILTMWNASGGTTNIEVDFSEAVIEAEAGDGLYVKADHSLNVGIASSSETVTISDGNGGSTQAAVLSVNADSIEVQNIQNAIDYKVSTLDKTDDAAVAGQYVAAIEETDGIVAVKTRANVSEAVLNNYSKGSDATAVAATDTVNQAVSKLENQIDKAKAAATTKVVEGTDAGNNMTIVPTTSSTDSSVTYTINLSDVASDSALTAEIAARKAVDGQDGQTYVANANTNYIGGATSLNDADVKLDAALKARKDEIDGLSAKTVTAVEMTGGTAAISAHTDGTKKITINTDGSQILATGYDATGVAADQAIAVTDSINQALAKLYVTSKAHHALSSSTVSVSEAANGTTFTVNVDTNTAHSAADDTYASDNQNMIQIKNGGLYVSSSIDCGTF